MTPADPPSGRALSDERLAQLRRLIGFTEGPAAELLAEVDRLTAERQEIDVRAAMGEDALLRVTAERDAAREALAASREALTGLFEVGPDEPLMEDPSTHRYTFWFYCGTTRKGHDDDCPWQRALAAARPDEPTGEAGCK